MRTCFFTDVEHLRHAIQAIFPDVFPGRTLFTAAPYLPPNARWENLFKFIAAECGRKGEFRGAHWTRSYWHVTEEISFSPWPPGLDAEDSELIRWAASNRANLARFLNAPSGGDSVQYFEGVRDAEARLRSRMDGKISPEALAEIPKIVGELKTERRKSGKPDIPDIPPSALPGARAFVRAIQAGEINSGSIPDPEMRSGIAAVVGALRERMSRAGKIYDAQRWAQNKLALECRSVEFRRAGSVEFNLFTDCCVREKAVDVNLSLDMLLLRDIYDVAVILSGDQDFVPAARAAKNAGKIVVNVAFHTEKSREFFPKGAKKLDQIVDWRIQVQYSDFRKFLGLDTPD